MSRTHPFAGGISGNRYVFGGLETAIATAALALAAVGVSGTAEADPYTSPSAGMIGTYRTITAVNTSTEAVGASTITLSASAVANTSAENLTASWAGMISRYHGDITQSVNTQFELFLTTVLGGSVTDFTERAFDIPLAANLAGAATPLLRNPTRGAGAITLSASGRSGAIGQAALSLSVFGAGVGIGSPAITGSGEGRITLSAAAAGLATWPMQPQAVLTLSAAGASETEAQAYGIASLTLSAATLTEQEGQGNGGAVLTLAAQAYSGDTVLAQGEAILTLEARGVSGGILAPTERRVTLRRNPRTIIVDTR